MKKLVRKTYSQAIYVSKQGEYNVTWTTHERYRNTWRKVDENTFDLRDYDFNSYDDYIKNLMSIDDTWVMID